MIKIDPDKSNAQRSAKVRADRDARIAACDWTQAADVSALMSTNQRAAWVKYRQALRDVPAQNGFPASVNWPASP